MKRLAGSQGPEEKKNIGIGNYCFPSTKETTPKKSKRMAAKYVSIPSQNSSPAPHLKYYPDVPDAITIAAQAEADKDKGPQLRRSRILIWASNETQNHIETGPAFLLQFYSLSKEWSYAY
ncbi:unnamed protein product [Phytophthora fragariaefolia]|uniref:Unnamed protein product n=1 Tax=Phytophthora fragariaefolia TaxID=1490495 RepID=A0A9W6X7N8_9STRA|nr:unnamed protein product [Phytophthora fragariaefolia]